MNVRVIQTANRGPAAVALLELEIAPAPAPSLFVVVFHLPADARGRKQHWTRTESDQGDALALYDQFLSEHIIAPAAE